MIDRQNERVNIRKLIVNRLLKGECYIKSDYYVS